MEHTIIRHIDLIESGIIKDYTDDKGSGSSNSNDTNLVSLFFIPYIGFISIINVWIVIFSLLGTVMDQKNMDGLCMLSRFIKRSL